MTDGASLWMRRWRLSVGPAAGIGAIDLSDLAFHFSVDQVQYQTPWIAKITVFNVGNEVISGMEKELNYVWFNGGYQPPSQQYGRVFGGPIAYFKHGRLNATDTFIEITAIQQDTNLDSAIINAELPAGSTNLDIVRALKDAMPGVSLGYITDLGSATTTRSRILYGRPTDILRDVMQTANAQAHVDDANNLNILKEGEALPTVGQVPVLNTTTGMVDVPTQTLGGGIEVRCLLNPAIRPGTKIQVNQKDITSYTAGPGLTGLPDDFWKIFGQTMPIQADGFYVVCTVRHWGENRGNPWYSDITTMPLGPVQPGVKTGA